MAFKVADFFAQLSLRVDTTQINKLKASINSLNAALSRVGGTLASSLGRVDSATALEKKKQQLQVMINKLREARGDVTAFTQQLAHVNDAQSYEQLRLAIMRAREEQRQLNRETRQADAMETATLNNNRADRNRENRGATATGGNRNGISDETALDAQRLRIEKLLERLRRINGETTEFSHRLSTVGDNEGFERLRQDIERAALAQRQLNQVTRERERMQDATNANNIRDTNAQLAADRAVADQRTRLTSQAAFQNSVNTLRRSRGDMGADERRQRFAELRRIRGMVDGTTASYGRASAALGRLNSAINQSVRASRRQANAFGTIRHQVNLLRTSFVQMAASMLGAFGIMAGARKVFDVTRELESFQAMLATTSNGTADAADTTAYLNSEAERLGLNVLEMGKSFTKFQASISPEDMDKDTIKEVFTGVNEAITALQLSGEQAKFVQRALVQMASKGKISMEELRLQMGENMPGALRLFAEGLGVTTGELDEMAKRGELISAKTLPQFSRRLREFAAPGLKEAVANMNANINRMGNAWISVTDAFRVAGFSKAVSSVASVITDLGLSFKWVAQIFGGFVKVFFGFTSLLFKLAIMPFRALQSILDKLGWSLEVVGRVLGGAGFLFMLAKLGKLTVVIKLLNFFFNKWFLIAAGVAIVIEEIMAFFDDKKLGLFELIWLRSATAMEAFWDSAKTKAKEWATEMLADIRSFGVELEKELQSTTAGRILIRAFKTDENSDEKKPNSNIEALNNLFGGSLPININSLTEPKVPLASNDSRRGPNDRGAGQTISIANMSVVANNAEEFGESMAKVDYGQAFFA